MCDSSGLRRFEIAVFLFYLLFQTNNLKPTNDNCKKETCASAPVCAPLCSAKAGTGKGGRAAPSPLVEARREGMPLFESLLETPRREVEP